MDSILICGLLLAVQSNIGRMTWRSTPFAAPRKHCILGTIAMVLWHSGGGGAVPTGFQLPACGLGGSGRAANIQSGKASFCSFTSLHLA